VAKDTKAVHKVQRRGRFLTSRMHNSLRSVTDAVRQTIWRLLAKKHSRTLLLLLYYYDILLVGSNFTGRHLCPFVS